MTPRGITLEICVDELAGVAAAIAGGADRLELCAALPLGGLTPSLAFVRAARATAGMSEVALHAIVRPRTGDFAYDAGELAQAIDEGLMLIDAGVDGLVFGAARDGALDHTVMERWLRVVRECRPSLLVTLHRAIDTLSDPVAAVRVAADIGINRILTSGGAAAAAAAGQLTIARMCEAAGDRLEIMAGGGVRAENVVALLESTGVSSIHSSASGPPVAAGPTLEMLGFAMPARRPASADAVRALRDRIDAYAFGKRGEPS